MAITMFLSVVRPNMTEVGEVTHERSVHLYVFPCFVTWPNLKIGEPNKTFLPLALTNGKGSYLDSQ